MSWSNIWTGQRQLWSLLPPRGKQRIITFGSPRREKKKTCPNNVVFCGSCIERDSQHSIAPGFEVRNVHPSRTCQAEIVYSHGSKRHVQLCDIMFHFACCKFCWRLGMLSGFRNWFHPRRHNISSLPLWHRGKKAIFSLFFKILNVTQKALKMTDMSSHLFLIVCEKIAVLNKITGV